MYRPRYCSTELSNPRWGTVSIAWVAFVLGPLAVMVVISYPLVGVGLLVGMVLSILATRVRNIRRRPDARGESTGSRPSATDGGASDDASGSGSGGRDP